MFFGTNKVQRSSTNALDNAFLVSQQMGTWAEVCGR